MDSALAIAETIVAGFNKHYRIFRRVSADAKLRFERRAWQQQRDANRLRIDLYDARVNETVQKLWTELPDAQNELFWPEIKRIYIALLYGHKQPELAETFFNSVAARVLRRGYFTNEHIFTRPAVSTEHIEGEQPTYRCYYPLKTGLRGLLRAILRDFDLDVPVVDWDDSVRGLLPRLRAWISTKPWGQDTEPNFQVQVLTSLFFRNKDATIFGCVVNGKRKAMFAAALRNEPGGLVVDAFLHEHEHLVNLLSVANAYFMVDMEVPSSWVSFLHEVLADKPKAELYMAVGLQKQGKTVFFRDLEDHLKHSDDFFDFAPGARGLVMFVFTLPSYPYVFKVIRDFFPPPKDTSREAVMEKYRLVKLHDRVGRLADTLEYVDVALPQNRFCPELLTAMRETIGSSMQMVGDHILLRHLYIEQRLRPLDLFLEDAHLNSDEERIRHGVTEFGAALQDLAAANIFPGDLLPKNFGLSPYGRCLLYDYDEVTYLTDCHFRPLPRARDDEEELRGEPWFSVGPNDVFPEEFPAFLFSKPLAKRLFHELCPDLLDPAFWSGMQEEIRAGSEPDLFPYPSDLRILPGLGPGIRRRQKKAA